VNGKQPWRIFMSRIDRRSFLRASAAGTATAAAGLSVAVPSLAWSQTPAIKTDRVFKPFAFSESYTALTDAYFTEMGLDPDLANGPWEMLLATLGRYVSGGDSKNVQLVTAPRAADWNHKVYGQYRLSKVLGDAMPKWGATFDPALGNSYGLEYAIYISNISIPAPDPTKQRELDAAKTQWADAVGVLSRAVSSSGDRWAVFNKKQMTLPPSKRKDFDWWYANIELKFLAPKEQDVKTKGQRYAGLVAATSGGWQEVANAINAYNELSAKYLVPAEGAEDDRKENVYRYLVSPTLDDFIFASQRNSAQKIQDYDQYSMRKSVSQTSWGGGASFGGFIGFGASGGSSHIDWHTNDFAMSFSAKGIQRFDVSPGDWYSANLIKMWNILDFQPNGPIDRAIRTGTLWGEHGIFNLRSAGIIVAYAPEITLRLSKADYERNASWWSGSAGISIGPFSFGASAGGSREDVTFVSGSNQIICKDGSGIPKIIAVTTDVLPLLT
jgi:hypothetical protein